MTRHDVLPVVAARLALFFTFRRKGNSGVCSAISMNVATIFDLQILMTMINCAGQGVLYLTWIADCLSPRQSKSVYIRC